jgi:NAD(P)-dependent dehydrogenase (short-subunit alcohol dehydrogenase family)
MKEINAFQLHNKNIVITGASSGIGRQCAITASKLGARVVLIARNKEKLEETLSLMDRPQEHFICQADLMDFENTEKAVKTVMVGVEKMHGIIHAAGISTTLPLRSISSSKMDDYFKTNVYGSVELTRLLTKPTYLTEQGGSVIFLTSVMGVVGEVGKTIYSLTKGALVAGSKSMALELAPKKIRVNCVSPGVVVTPMSSSAVYTQDEASREKIKGLHPLGLGATDDIANACVFLLADASRWITGTNLTVDGGYTAR